MILLKQQILTATIFIQKTFWLEQQRFLLHI